MKTESSASPSAPAAPSSPARAASPVPRPAVPHRGARSRRRLLLIAAGVAVLVIVLVATVVATQRAQPVAPTEVAPSTERVIARGQVRPVSQARVGTLEGGVVRQLSVEPGDAVEEQQEIARIRGAATTEILTAPLRGTVTDVLVHVGDTVTPGSTVALVGDLSRLQVETTDVDEFIVDRIRRGQRVRMTFEALDRRELQGTVRSVALQPRTTTAGDELYPVVIDLATWPPDLRPGMTARITFAE